VPPFSLPVREIAALLVLLVGIGAGWIALRADADDPDRRGLVVGVVDGDTVDVRVLATRERVRVLGIDTPETGSCLSRQATAETNRLTLGRLVKLQRDPSQPERDRLDRLLAYVELPGERDLGLELLKRGFARVFVVGRPFKRLESYRKAESVGRAQSPSIWSC
jgi:endonuclease YncB( thermonuclease family)